MQALQKTFFRKIVAKSTQHRLSCTLLHMLHFKVGCVDFMCHRKSKSNNMLVANTLKSVQEDFKHYRTVFSSGLIHMRCPSESISSLLQHFKIGVIRL